MGGVSSFKILAKVIVPLIKPGLVYTWIWTSLSAYRELTMAVFSLLAEEPGIVDLYLGTVAWRRARRCRGDRDHDDRGDVAAGDDLLDLRAQAATRGFVGVD